MDLMIAMGVRRDGRMSPDPSRPHTPSQQGGARPTSTQILLHKFHLQVEDLLLELTDGMLRSLPPGHHVAQVPNLRRRKRDCSPYSFPPISDPPSPGASWLEKVGF